MENTKWHNVLIEWVNCLKLCKNVQNVNELRSGKFFDNLQKVITKSSDANPDILTFIFELIGKHYPNYVIENKTEVHLADLPEVDLKAVTSLLMHFTCIYDRREVLTSPLCHSLSQSTQLIIRNFLQKVSKEVTNETMNDIIKSCIDDASDHLSNRWLSVETSSTKDSPLQDLLKTPASKFGRLQEKDRIISKLNSDLEVERYEKADLQEELKLQLEKNKKIEQQLIQKTNEITRLRSEVLDLENRTPPHYQDMDSRELQRRLRAEIQSLEQYIKQIEMEQDEIRKEKDSAKDQVRQLESQCNIWQEKFFETERNFEHISENSRKQEEELRNLQEHCAELSTMLEEYRVKPADDSSLFASFSSANKSLNDTLSNDENLASVVVDVQLREVQKKNDELEKVVKDVRSELKKSEIANEELVVKVKSLECDSEIVKKQLAEALECLEVTKKESREFQEALEQLQDEKQTLETHLSKAQAFCERMKIELEDFRVQNAKISEELLETKEERRRLLLQLEETSDLLETVKKQSEDLNKNKGILEAKVEETQALVQRLTVETEKICEEFEATTKQLQEDNASLETKLQLSQETVVALKKKGEERESKLTEVETLLETMKIEKLKITGEHEAAARQLASALQRSEEIIEDFGKKNEELSVENGKLQARLEESEAVVDALKMEKEKITEKIGAIAKQLEEEKGVVASKLEQSEETCRKLEKKNEDLLSENEGLQKQQRVLEAQVQEIEASLEVEKFEKLKITEALEAKLQESHENCLAEQKKIEEMDTEREILQKQEIVLQAQLLETHTLLETVKLEKMKISEALEEARMLLQSKEEICINLEETIEEMTATAKQLEEERATIDAQLRQSEENRLDLEKMNEQLSTERDNLQQQQNVLHSQLEETRTLLETVKLEKIEISEALEDERAALCSKNEICLVLEKKNEELLSENKKIREQQDALEAHTRKIEMEIEDVVFKKQKTYEELVETKRNLWHLQETYQDLEKRHVNLQEDHERLKDTRVTIEMRLDEAHALTVILTTKLGEANDKLSEARKNSEELEEEKERLLEDLQNLEERYADLETLNEELNAQIEGLQRQLDEQIEILANSQKEYDELSEAQIASEARLVEAEANNQKVREQMKKSGEYALKIEEEKQMLLSKLDDLEKRNMELSTQLSEALNALELSRQESEELKKAYDKLETRLNQLQEELETVKVENQKVTEHLTTTKEHSLKLDKEKSNALLKLAESQEMLDVARKESSILRNSKNELETELLEARETFLRLEKEKEKALLKVTEFEKRNRKLISYTNTLQKQVAAVNQKLEAKDEELEQQQVKFNVYKNEKNSLLIALEAFRRQLAEMMKQEEEMKANRSALETQLSDSIGESEKLKEELEGIVKEKRKLQTDKDELLQQLKEVELQKEKLLSEKKVLQAQLEEATEDLESTRKASKELKEAKNLIEKQLKETSTLSEMLKMQLEDLQVVNRQANFQLEESEESVDKLKREKDDLSLKLKEANGRNEELLQLTEDLQRQISEASTSLTMSKNRSEELQEMQKNLERQLVEVQALLDELRVEKEETKESLSKLEEENRNLVKKCEDHEEVQNALEAELSEVRVELEEMQKRKEDLENRQLEIVTLQERVERLNEEKSGLEKKIEVEEFVASQTQEKMKTLEETIQDYAITISGLKSVIDNNLESLETLKDDKIKLVDEILQLKNRENEIVLVILQLLKDNGIACGKDEEINVKSLISENLAKILTTKNEEIENLKSEIVTITKTNNAFKETIRKLDDLVTDQVEMGSLGSLKTSFDNIHEKVNQAMRIKERLVEDLCILESDKHSLVKELEEVKKSKTELDKQLIEEREKVVNLRKELESSSRKTVKTEKENILGVSTKSNKSREEELKKENMALKKKVVLTENAKNNLEKVLKELRQEKKKEGPPSPIENDALYKKLLQEYIQVKEEHEQAMKEKDAKLEELTRRCGESTVVKSEDEKKLSQDLQNIREAYGNVMSVNSKLELEIVTLRKLIEERNSQLGDLAHVKEAYEKLLEENNKLMMEIDTVKYKRTRDKEEFIRLLKKDREEMVAKETKQIQDIRAEYEGKLEKMKDKMLKLYREEVNKKVKSVKEGQNENTHLMKTVNDLRRELLDAEQKIQFLEMEKEILKTNRRLEIESNKMVPLQSVSSSSVTTITTRNEERASTLPRSTITEEVTISRRTSIGTIPTIAQNLQMEDEEDLFNDKYLADLKAGHCALPNNRESTARFSELAWRNSLCPPHLKSSYPAELQFISPTRFKDDDIKTGNIELDDSLCKLLPGEKRSKKDFGTTSYKKPGPPTPSKNGGRLSLQGNEVHPMREHCEAKTPKKSTPSRIRALFTGRTSSTREESQNTTPTRQKRLSFFRKPK